MSNERYDISRTSSKEEVDEMAESGEVEHKKLSKDETLAATELSTSSTIPGVDANANSENAPPNPDAPPDGGREAWLCVIGGVCSWFATFGWIYSEGSFQEYYSQGPLKNYSASEVAWIPSVEVFFAFALGPLAGKLFNSYGSRAPLLIGSFLHIFGLMMTSLSSKCYQFFFAQSVCSAIGISLIFFTSMNTALTWFSKKRATAMGIMTAGSSAGGVVLPIMITRLIPKIGFPWTVRAVAFIFLAFLVVTNLTMKSRLSHKPQPFDPLEFLRPLRDTPFALLCLAGGLVVLGSFLPYTFISLQGQRNGMSYSLSNYLIPVMNAAGLVGRLASGVLGDKFGRYNMLILTSAIATIFTFGLWIPAHDSATLFVFAAISGYTTGGIFSVGPAAIAQISEAREIEIRNGTLFFCAAIGVLIGNPIGGALISRNGGDYLYVEIFSGAVLAASLVCFVVSRSMKVGLWKVKIY